MILTDAGFDALYEGRDAVFSWLRSLIGFSYSSPPLAYQQSTPRPQPAARTVMSFQPGDGSSESRQDVRDENALSPREQKARVVALRGLSQAREGEFAAARETFGDAIRLDPDLDLSRLPSFWKQPRQTHDCVVDALYDADRTRDAAALIANLRTRFRPRLLPSRMNR
jgi:hypothetical protein